MALRPQCRHRVPATSLGALTPRSPISSIQSIFGDLQPPSTVFTNRPVGYLLLPDLPSRDRSLLQGVHDTWKRESHCASAKTHVGNPSLRLPASDGANGDAQLIGQCIGRDQPWLFIVFTHLQFNLDQAIELERLEN